MFRIGQSVFMQWDAGKGLTSVAGFRPGVFALLDVRTLTAKPVIGAKLLLKCFENGNYLNYETSVTGYLSSLGFMAVTPPERIGAPQHRRNRRYYFNLPLAVRFPRKGEGERTVIMKDVSLCGLRFVADEYIEIGEPLLLRGRLRPGLDLAGLAGSVVRREELVDGFSYGVAFDDRPVGVGADAVATFLEELAFFDELADVEPEEEATPVGQNLMVDIGGRKVTSRIRGYRRGEWLLTDIPTVAGGSLVVGAGEEVHADCRFLRNGVAHGFTVTFARQYTAPAPLWVWSYPTQLEKAPIRSSPRVRTAVSAEFDGRPATLLDISQGGGRLAVGGNGYLVGDRFRLTLHPPDGSPIEGLTCDTRRITVVDGVSYLGVSFIQEESYSLARVARLYRSLAREKFDHASYQA
jgi:hypothetical protein